MTTEQTPPPPETVMGVVQGAFYSWLVKSVLTYASRWTWSRARPHWERLSGKRVQFEEPQNVLAAARARALEEGTLVEVPGLLSKYAFDYQPMARAPFFLASTVDDVREFEDGGGRGNVAVQKALAACGENPTFDDGSKLFYLYRPVFRAFPSRFSSDDPVEAQNLIRKYSALYQRIPVIGHADLILHAEHRNRIVGRASYMPFEVMAEIYGVSRVQYDAMSARGENFALLINDQLREEVKRDEPMDRLQDHLWVGLFAEFLFDPVAEPGSSEHEKLVARLQELVDSTVQSVLPGAGPRLSKEIRAQGATRSVIRTDFYTVGMHAWNLTPLYAVYQSPSALALHMASDVREDAIRDEEVFYAWAALVAKELPGLLAEVRGGPVGVELDFVSNFARARAAGLRVLESPSADRLAASERLRHTVAWLRTASQ